MERYFRPFNWIEDFQIMFHNLNLKVVGSNLRRLTSYLINSINKTFKIIFLKNIKILGNPVERA